MTEIPASVIIIAAGFGSRLMPLTENKPKCMLPVQSIPILHRALSTFDELGLDEITVIGGYQVENLILPSGVQLVINPEYQSNNILHSLSYARNEFAYGMDTVVSYADIVFAKRIVEELLSDSRGEISLLVDTRWKRRYDGRDLHIVADAEWANFDSNGRLLKIGKGLIESHIETDDWGEFIGLMKFTTKGVSIFWDTFEEINQQLKPDQSFQSAPEWQKSYLADLFQELVDRGIPVNCVPVEGGWEEIDTKEDYDYAQDFNFSQ